MRPVLSFDSPGTLERAAFKVYPDKKIIFMGTPDFACPALEALLESGWQICAVVCNPDRPVGRKQILTSPPVKELAERYALPVFQWERLKDRQDILETLSGLKADLIITAAYGLLLPREILELPPFGCINIHPSLLPLHRGAAPVTASLLAGDRETGVSIFKMGEGLDDGPVLARSYFPLSERMTQDILSEKLARQSAALLLRLLPLWFDGEIEGEVQDESRASYIHKLSRNDGALDFSRSAEELERQIRAFFPWPGSFAWQDGKRYKFLEAEVGESRKGQPGEIEKEGRELWICCKKGSLRPLRWQIPSGKTVDVSEMAHNFKAGERFTKEREEI